MRLTRFAQTSSTRDLLSCICKYYGVRPDLVQAGGGNISIKHGDELFIKSSGCTLFDVEPDKNISVVDLSEIKSFNDSSNRVYDSEKEFLESSTILGSQPSLETFFHAKTLKYTAHLHPPLVIQALDSCKQKLIDNYESIAEFVDYYRPGLELSDHITGDKKIIFLDNHGLIVHSNDLNEVFKIIDDVTVFCEKVTGHRLICNKISYVQNYLYEKFNEICYVIITDAPMDNLRKTPDCVIYSGGTLYHMSDDCEIRPTCISYDGYNFIASKSFLRCKQIEEVLKANAIVASASLSISDVNSLLGWDSEKYRQKEI